MDEYKLLESIYGMLSGVLAGGIFLILLFLLHWNIWVDGLLAVGSFVGLSMILKPRRRIGGVYIDELPNGEEVKRRLDEAREDFRSIEKSMKTIDNPAVKQEAGRLKETAEKIIHFLEQNPEKIKLARQFIDYYQDTASSLLQKYLKIEETNLNTEETEHMRERIIHGLQTMNVAFEQQFEKLMRNEMFDMEAEIQLLEQTVKEEKGNI